MSVKQIFAFHFARLFVYHYRLVPFIRAVTPDNLDDDSDDNSRGITDDEEATPIGILSVKRRSLPLKKFRDISFSSRIHLHLTLDESPTRTSR